MAADSAVTSQLQPWFRVRPPPPFGADPAVITGEREPRPIVVDGPERNDSELRGDVIRKDLERIVDFARQSKATRADSWFDGAGDNADGLAVTLALARYFAKPENSDEAPIVIGVTNRASSIEAIIDAGTERYGTNFVSARSAMQSGQTGGFEGINAPKITIMQAPPLYHATGEVLDVISTPGLERMACFLAFFLKESDKLTGDQLNARH